MGIHFQQQTSKANAQERFDHTYNKGPGFFTSLGTASNSQTVALANEIWAYVPGKGFNTETVVPKNPDGTYDQPGIAQIRRAFHATENFTNPGEPALVINAHHDGNTLKSTWNITTYDINIDDQVRDVGPNGTKGPINLQKRQALIEAIKALAANQQPIINGVPDPDWVPMTFRDDKGNEWTPSEVSRPCVINEHIDGSNLHLRVQISRVHYEAQADPANPGQIKDVKLFGRARGTAQGLGIPRSEAKPEVQAFNRLPIEDISGAGLGNWTQYLAKKGFVVSGYNSGPAPGILQFGQAVAPTVTQAPQAAPTAPVAAAPTTGPGPLAQGVTSTTPGQSIANTGLIARAAASKDKATLQRARDALKAQAEAYEHAIEAQDRADQQLALIEQFDKATATVVALAGAEMPVIAEEEGGLENAVKLQAAAKVLEARHERELPLVETGSAFVAAIEALHNSGMTAAELAKAQAELKTQHVKGDIDDEELAEKLAELEAVIPSIDIAEITPAAAVSSYVEKAEFAAKVEALKIGEDGENIDVFIQEALEGVTPLKALDSHVVLAEVKDSLESSGIELKGVGVAAAVDGVLTELHTAKKELVQANAKIEEVKPLLDVLEHLADVPEIAAAPSIEAKAEFLENSVERLSKALESSRKAQAEKEQLLIENDDLNAKLKPLEDFIAYKETFAEDLEKLGVEVNTPKDALSKLLRTEANNASTLEELARASEQLSSVRNELRDAKDQLSKAQSTTKQELNHAVTAAKQEAEKVAQLEKALAVSEAKEQVRKEMAEEMSRLRAELDALRAPAAPAVPVRGVAPATPEDLAARQITRPTANPDNQPGGPEIDPENKPK